MAEAADEKFTFFWGKRSPFSQHYLATFMVDGVRYCCAEQYMMHQKARLFGDEEIADLIMKTESPSKHKKLGKQVRGFDQKTWEEKCTSIVRTANMHKFTQNPDLKEKLLETKGTTLVEASPTDTIWGIGLSEKDTRAISRKTWRGKNLLGQILTELRDEIEH